MTTRADYHSETAQAFLDRARNYLADESADPSLHALFHSANALDQNFYEGLMSQDGVAVGVDQVAEFVRRLDPDAR